MNRQIPFMYVPSKILVVLFFLLLSVKNNALHAQFLKNILNSAKQTSQNRADNKVDRIANKALDKVDSLGKKKSKGNTSSQGTNTVSATGTPQATTAGEPPAPTTGQAATTASTNAASDHPSTPPDNEYNSGESFIKLNLSSSKTLAGCAITISGSSIMYKNFNSVTLTITGAGSETKRVALDTSGNFKTFWQAKAAGTYTILAKSSDGKNQLSKTLDVYAFENMDLITTPLQEETTKAYDKLKTDIDKVKTALIGQDAEALQKKMDAFTEKKDKVLKQLTDAASASKGLNDVEKKYGALPSTVLENVSDMTDVISAQTNQVEQAIAATDHQAYDNSVCEYLVMVSEACAAFSTFLNFEGKFTKILTNLAGDKAGRAVAGYNASAITGSDAAGKASGECASLFIGAATESEALKANFNPLSFGGDIVQMCSDLLLKKYCAVMSGKLNHTYQCTFRNKSSDVWWDYNYSTKAVISLRYPKNNAGGNIIKMKGNIEGNATKFAIYQNAEQIDAFKDAMKGREGLIQFFALQLHKPIAVPFSAASADKDIGFGAVARALAVPASFNIPIDADYDVAQKKITIYVNDALVDFTPAVCYIYGYVAIAAGIPLVTRVNYPINSVKLTLGKAIKTDNTFNVTADAKNNLTVDGTGETKIGDEGSSIEHHINFSFNLKSE